MEETELEDLQIMMMGIYEFFNEKGDLHNFASTKERYGGEMVKYLIYLDYRKHVKQLTSMMEAEEEQKLFKGIFLSASETIEEKEQQE